MIQTKNLTKTFGKLVAANNVNLKICDNECFALLGLNGAGKTTFLNMISTQIIPSEGTASINGFDLVSEKEKIRKIINVSPQENAVAKNLTVKENLNLIATLYDVPDKQDAVARTIEEFGLTEKENTQSKKLSGGQSRRLSIALAMITSPQILFLDEPTLGLDVKARKVLWDTIEKLKHKITIILTTHYLEEVEYLADRIAIMSKGKIKVCGNLQEIKEKTNCDSLEQAFLNLTEEE